MIEPLTYLNGQFLPQPQVHLAFNDAGFVFGATVTDQCRTFRHQLFRLSDHLVRFRQSCRLARIPQPLADDELTLIAEKLVAHNAALLGPEQDLALVMVATPGPIAYYLGEEGGLGDGTPTLALHTFPLPFARHAHLFREGAHLVVLDRRHLAAGSLDPHIKHRNRLHWWLADQEAREIEAWASALLLDGEGHVTETSTANFLLVRGGVVFSPARTAVLGGISLLTVEELCAELGLGFEEKPLSLQDCLAADEAMLASTPYCLAGVNSINGVVLPWPGPVWQRLLAAWSRRVGIDIRQQILAAR